MKNTILLVFAATALAFTACQQTTPAETAQHNQPGEATADTAVVYRNGQAAPAAQPATLFVIDRATLRPAKFPEIRLPNITVTEDSTYSVYAVKDDVLFDTDKAAIKPAAAATLDEIANSIGTRFANRDVEVMGFADSRGDASYNLQLGQERANAVKAFLVKNSKLTKNKVDTESFGEQKPVATNATPAGRQQNRRVEIVVRKK